MGGAGNGPAFFIAAQRKELEQTEEIPQLITNIGADEKELKRRAEIPHVTVAARRNELERCGQIDHVSTTVDTTGREQPRQRKPVSVFNPSKREERAMQSYG